MSKKYIIYCRNFIPTKTCLGFQGDNRNPSTSIKLPNSKHRTGVKIYIDMELLKVTHIETTGDNTTPITPFAKLIKNISKPIRKIQHKKILTSNVTIKKFTQQIKLINDKKTLSFYIYFAGNNPAVVGAPSVKNHLYLDLNIDDNILSISGNIYGNEYPSNEVFIIVNNSTPKSSLLSSFNAKGNFFGPIIKLTGNRKKLLSKIEKKIIVNSGPHYF